MASFTEYWRHYSLDGCFLFGVMFNLCFTRSWKGQKRPRRRVDDRWRFGDEAKRPNGLWWVSLVPNCHLNVRRLESFHSLHNKRISTKGYTKSFRECTDFVHRYKVIRPMYGLWSRATIPWTAASLQVAVTMMQSFGTPPPLDQVRVGPSVFSFNLLLFELSFCPSMPQVMIWWPDFVARRSG